MGKDYFYLKSYLAESVWRGDRDKTDKLMKDFFKIQKTSVMPYKGLIVLDKDKNVFSAYSTKMDEKEISKMIGSSYAGIVFKGSEKSLHKVLRLYRVDKDHPMGHKGIEVAFEMEKEGRFLGWLIFQMDMDLLEKAYGLDEEGLKKFRFEKEVVHDEN